MRVVLHMLRFALVALSTQCGLGAAQNYPAGPLRVIVPYPPGGGTDILSRAIALKLNETWGQPVVVENRGGANGNIGTAMAARANPDGHTIAEAGVPGYAMINWYGMLVPAATSKPVLSKLHAETVRIPYG